jgi:hypothetical protein
MQTQTILVALLSAMATQTLAQVPLNAAVMRVDPGTQRQRDEARVSILQDELAAEAAGLADAQRILRAEETKRDPKAAEAASQRIARYRQNISALAKEIALAERQLGGTPAVARPDGLVPNGKGDASAATRSSPQIRTVQPGRPAAPDWFIPANGRGDAGDAGR